MSEESPSDWRVESRDHRPGTRNSNLASQNNLGMTGRGSTGSQGSDGDRRWGQICSTKALGRRGSPAEPGLPGFRPGQLSSAQTHPRHSGLRRRWDHQDRLTPHRQLTVPSKTVPLSWTNLDRANAAPAAAPPGITEGWTASEPHSRASNSPGEPALRPSSGTHTTSKLYFVKKPVSI